MFSVVQTFLYTKKNFIIFCFTLSYASQDSWKLTALTQTVREQTLETTPIWTALLSGSSMMK